MLIPKQMNSIHMDLVCNDILSSQIITTKESCETIQTKQMIGQEEPANKISKLKLFMKENCKFGKKEEEEEEEKLDANERNQEDDNNNYKHNYNFYPAGYIFPSAMPKKKF